MSFHPKKTFIKQLIFIVQNINFFLDLNALIFKINFSLDKTAFIQFTSKQKSVKNLQISNLIPQISSNLN